MGFKNADNFQPGELVDWVRKDGSQRANGTWDGSKVLERNGEGYDVETPDGGQGWIAADELVPHKEAPKPEPTLARRLTEEMLSIPSPDDVKDQTLWESMVNAAVLTPEPDVISEPAHYKAGMPEGIEVRDIIKAQGFWKEFCAGNVIKYSLRWQYKNGIEDLKKMLQYGQWLVEELEAEND